MGNGADTRPGHEERDAEDPDEEEERINHEKDCDQ